MGRGLGRRATSQSHVEHVEGEEDVALPGDDVAVAILIVVEHKAPLVVLHVNGVSPGTAIKVFLPNCGPEVFKRKEIILGST